MKGRICAAGVIQPMSSQQRMIQSWRHVNNGIEARFTGQEHVVGETKNLTYCVSRSVVSNPL